MTQPPFEVKRNGRRVTVPSRAMDKAADKLSPRNLQKVTALADSAMKAYLLRVTGPLLARHARPWSWGSRSANLARRSGAGLKALASPFTRMRAGMVEGVVSLPFHMVQQEYGGVIRAKEGKYLAIPLPGALNPDGTVKKRSIREWQNTFVVKGKRGGLVICTMRGRRTIPLYALRKTVKTPARLGLRKQMRAERTSLQRDIAKRIRALIYSTV